MLTFALETVGDRYLVVRYPNQASYLFSLRYFPALCGEIQPEVESHIEQLNTFFSDDKEAGMGWQLFHLFEAISLSSAEMKAPDVIDWKASEWVEELTQLIDIHDLRNRLRDHPVQLLFLVLPFVAVVDTALRDSYVSTTVVMPGERNAFMCGYFSEMEDIRNTMLWYEPESNEGRDVTGELLLEAFSQLVVAVGEDTEVTKRIRDHLIQIGQITKPEENVDIAVITD